MNLLEELAGHLLFLEMGHVYSETIQFLKDNVDNPPKVVLTEQPNFNPSPSEFSIICIQIISSNGLRICYRGEERII